MAFIPDRGSLGHAPGEPYGAGANPWNEPSNAAVSILPQAAPPQAAPPMLAALPQLTIANDPTYLSYLRSSGYNEDSARMLAARQVDQLKRRVSMAIPGIQEAGIEQRRGIGNSFEARGVFASGERLRQQALQQRAETSQIAGLQGGLADQVGNIEIGLRDQIGQLANQRGERAAQAQQSADEQNRYNEILRKNGLL